MKSENDERAALDIHGLTFLNDLRCSLISATHYARMHAIFLRRGALIRRIQNRSEGPHALRDRRQGRPDPRSVPAVLVDDEPYVSRGSN
jgi:hypothetical protein